VTHFGVSRHLITPDLACLFLRGVTFHLKDEFDDLQSLLFWLLLRAIGRASNTKQFRWTSACVLSVSSGFRERANFPRCCFALFLAFVCSVLDSFPDEAHQTQILELILFKFEEGHEIVTSKHADDLLTPLNIWITKFDRTALNIVAHIASSKRATSEQLANVLLGIPDIFTSRVEIHWRGFNVGTRERIHAIGYRFDGKFVIDNDSKMIANAGGSELRELPAALTISPFALFEVVPDAVIGVISLVKEFLKRLPSETRRHFFRHLASHLKRFKAPECYSVFAALFILVRDLDIPEIVQRNAPYLCGEIVFDPQVTYFGPVLIDDVTNQFRAAAVHLVLQKGQDLIFELALRFALCPFMLSELLGRILANRDFSTPTMLSIASSLTTQSQSGETVRIVAHALLALREMDASFAARIPLFLFLSELARNPQTMFLALDSHVFVDSYFKFLAEEAFFPRILNLLRAALVGGSRPLETPRLEYVVQGLLDAIHKFPAIVLDVFQVVLDIVRPRTFLGPQFRPFLNAFFGRLKADPSERMLDMTLQLLASLSPDVMLAPQVFCVLARHVTERNLLALTVLATGGQCASERGVWLIRRPEFLPLILVAVGRNAEKTEGFLRTCLQYPSISQTNVQMLHRGHVDRILLSFLKSGARYLSVDFVLRLSRALAMELLHAITRVESDYAVAREFLCDDSQLLHSFLIVLSTAARRRFPIGTLDCFAAPKVLSADDFKGPFAIAFWLFIDEFALFGVSATVDIVTIASHKLKLSVYLMNNTLFASLDDPGIHTFVTLCPRVPSNDWTHFVVNFTNARNSAGKVVVTTFRGAERVGDSEFSVVELEQGNVEVRFGGYTAESTRPTSLQMGWVSDVFVYGRLLSVSGVDVLTFDPAVRSRQGLLASTEMLTIVSNFPRKQLIRCINHSAFLRKVVRLYDQNPQDVLLAILAKGITLSTDVLLPAEFGAILAKQERSVRLYKQIVKIVERVADPETRFVWFEDILINCELWGIDNPGILGHWNSILLTTFSEFFIRKSYFRYFLFWFRELNADSLMLVKRVGRIVGNRLAREDAEFLFGLLFNSKNDLRRTCQLLEIIRDLADKISFENYECLLEFVSSRDLELTICAIQCLLTLSGNNFFCKIVRILSRLLPTAAVLARLEGLTDEFPDLFILNCAVCFVNKDLKLLKFPNFVNHWRLWFFFPVLCYLTCGPLMRKSLAGFIARNASVSNLESVLYLVAMLEHYVPDREFAPSRYLLAVLSEMGKKPDAMVFLTFASLICRLHPSNRSKELMEAHNQSPFGPNSFERNGFRIIPLSISDLESIKHWPFEKLSQRKFGFEIHLDGQSLDTILRLLRAQALEKEKGSYRELVSRIRKFCTETLPFLWTSKHETTGFRSHFSMRNHLFNDVIQRVQSDYTTRTSKILRLVNEMFADPRSIIPESRGITGRVNTKFGPVSAPKLHRSGFLTSFCTRTLHRVKSCPPQSRLLCQPGEFGCDAYLTSLQSRIPVKLERTDQSLVIISEESKIHINRSDITVLLPLNESMIVFIAQEVQYLLDFSPNSCLSFAECIGSILNFKTWLDGWTEKWVNNQITSFEYLCIVNLASGRVFNGELSQYPIFPSMEVNFSKCENFSFAPLSKTFQNESIEPGMIAAPELYFAPEFTRSFDKVYENRAKLEACKNLDVWLSKVFGTDRDNFLHRRVFMTPHLPRMPFPESTPGIWKINICVELKQKILFCHLTACLENTYNFLCVYTNGKIVFEQIFFEDGEAQFMSTKTGSGVSSGHFFGVGEGIIHYDSHLISFITANVTVKRDRVYLNQFIVSESICQVSETELCRLSIGSHFIELTNFTTIPAGILCFASCSKFNVTAVGCDDGKLRIRSNLTGRKVITVGLENEIPIAILITPAWGLIVVKTISSIFVFDVNGFSVRKVGCEMEFLRWTAFHTRDGFDFIAYQDSDQNSFCFEAANPAAVVPLQAGNAPLVCVAHDWRTDRFIFVAEAGNVLIFTRLHA
jgi:hypothetical protein